MNRAERKKSWDEAYVAYWQQRVAESGEHGSSKIIAGDAKTESDEIYEQVFDRHAFQTGSLVDVGCAWGRMFPLFIARGMTVRGADISTPMIAAARKEWSQHDAIADLQEADAESLPFADASADNVTCLAVFDATDQHLALAEFLRVLRPGGHLYLTGKNTCYEDDDDAARAAEIGARTKPQPNFFTDTRSMIDQMNAHGHTLIGSYYFPRRGDFAELRYQPEMPERFYEFFLIWRRGDDTKPFVPFSNDYSESFLNAQAD